MSPQFWPTPGGLRSVQRGSTVVTIASSTGSVAFPTPFPAAPIVMCVNGDQRVTLSPAVLTSVSATGFVFSTPGTPAGGFRVDWIAVL